MERSSHKVGEDGFLISSRKTFLSSQAGKGGTTRAAIMSSAQRQASSLIAHILTAPLQGMGSQQHVYKSLV